jgi:hypothetical protein
MTWSQKGFLVISVRAQHTLGTDFVLILKKVRSRAFDVFGFVSQQKNFISTEHNTSCLLWSKYNSAKTPGVFLCLLV